MAWDSAAAQSSDASAFDALRNTNVSLLDIGLRDLRGYVEDTLMRNHPAGLSPVAADAHMFPGINDIWIEVIYAQPDTTSGKPDCKAALQETGRLLIQPSSPSLPEQPGLLRIQEMFESPAAGGGPDAAGGSMAIMRHIEVLVRILDASRKAEESHCKARLLDL